MFKLSDKDTPLHEKLEIGLLLATVGGFLDVYSFLCYGGVFANAQTGNMVLLGVSLINGDFVNFLHYLMPILAFALGTLLADYLLKFFSGYVFVWVLIIEIITLFVIAFLPQNIPHVIVTSSISFICAIQIGSFRKICGAPYTSTMCTGNLRSAVSSLFIYLTQKDKSALIQSFRYLTIITIFCCGAALGAFFVHLWGTKSVLVCCLLFILLLYFIVKDILLLKQKQRKLSAYLGKE